MEQIQLEYNLPKQTTLTLIMFQKNTKNTMIHSSNCDTTFFNIVTGDLQGDTLSVFFYNLPNLQTSNVHRSNKMVLH